MQAPPKTDAEMIADRTAFERLVRNPATPSDEKDLYREMVKKIDTELARRKTAATAPNTAAAAAPKTASWRKVVSMPPSAGQPPQHVTISAQFNETFPRLITIEWGEGDTETVTEGRLLSKLKTCLRDLSESSKWEQRRYEECKFYLAYQRGVVYYAAITNLWGRAPTAPDLDIASKHRPVFDFVTTNPSQ